MKNKKESHMSVKNVKDTMDALEELSKETGRSKGGREILEDTASIILDVSATYRILVFQVRCKIKAVYNTFKIKLKSLFQ